MNQLNHYTTQQIFVIVKPGSLNLVPVIMERMKQRHWKVSKTTVKKLQLSEAEKLYEVHKDKDFYEDLCKYMASDLSRAFIFTRPGKVSDGVFEEVARLKDQIRDEYGESDMRNVMHSSDSISNMMKEASVYFNL